MSQRRTTPMPYRDLFFLWFLENLKDISHAIAGSFVYLLYGARLRRVDWKKAGITFVVGATFSIYASRQLCFIFPSLDKAFAGFFLGMMGMRLTEFALQYDLQIIADAVLAVFKAKK